MQRLQNLKQMFLNQLERRKLKQRVLTNYWLQITNRSRDLATSGHYDLVAPFYGQKFILINKEKRTLTVLETLNTTERLYWE